MAERPITIGKAKIAAGFTHQYLKYNTLGGRDLSGSNITVYKADLNRAPYFNYTLDLELSSMTDLFFVNYGATDKLDVAIAVPFVTVNLNGTTTQSGPNTSGARSTHSDRTAKGVGDVALRASTSSVVFTETITAWRWMRAWPAAMRTTFSAAANRRSKSAVSCRERWSACRPTRTSR